MKKQFGRNMNKYIYVTSKSLKKILTLICVMILFSSCGNRTKDQWTSWIYPDKNNTKRSMNNGVYDTLKICKISSLLKLKKLNMSTSGTYDCGLNCAFHNGMNTQICSEMSK